MYRRVEFPPVNEKEVYFRTSSLFFNVWLRQVGLGVTLLEF